jgi:hypothetical protein
VVIPGGRRHRLLALNLEWPVKFGVELVPSFHVEGCYGTVHQPQLNPLPGLECHFSMLAVVDRLVMLLRLVKAFPTLHEELIALLHLLLNHR